ncbi:MAG: tRNA (adenosine(37)-N6)-threonylcarbamoyltransferase complex ATPase subunit type 1 TsaE [Candidatus Liptonbacteria bacterium]|nr:tRNA (adenosine(37)-N6)-threonylcarbamoyltransferase complex ATPase subunit type 1 TsaE [Candidatus Liptonbacteria bacterium]
MRYVTTSARTTERLGQEITRETAHRFKKRTQALVFALDGPLGGGKTTFTKGIFKALGVRGRSVSPTFILLRRIKLRDKGSLYHADLYRLEDPRAIQALRLKEIFAAPENIVVIEWAKHAGRTLPKKTVRVSFEHGRNERERIIIVREDK